MKITKLRVNHLENPLGFLLEGTSFSWITESEKSTDQAAARVEVAFDEAFKNIVYDSGRDEEANSLDYSITLLLNPRTRYYWRVTVWTGQGEEATSETAWFETGKLEESWVGKWIVPSLGKDIHPVFHKEMMIGKMIKYARIYITALGVYELYINGKKVSQEYLMPGFHSYDLWMQYQTYDIGEYLTEGNNVIEVFLGNGWFKGRFGFDGGYTNIYGDDYYLIAELRILYEDDTEEILGTDSSWQCRRSPILFSNIYDGEIWDASLNSIASPEWKGTTEKAPVNTGALTARLSIPIIIKEERKPIEVIHTIKGEIVLDFGQNMTGWVQYVIEAPYGHKITLKYSEIMQEGCFYQENLRTARAEHIYISDGKLHEVRPHFTFYGFRYVLVEGLGEKLNPDKFTACIVMSDLEQTGFIETGVPEVNQLIRNVLWGQKGNFLDVPTDCPQRDERMGWTGDAQIFSGTACFNMYSPAFFTKYMYDLNKEQTLLEGSVPFTVPSLKPKNVKGFINGHGSTAWADAAVIIPWNLYLHYGSRSLLAQQYEGMKAWVDYIIRQDIADGDKKLWQTGFHFADWLALDNLEDPDSCMGGTDCYYVASAFYYYSTNILAKAAKVLGKEEDVTYYGNRALEIRAAIQAEYFSPNGKCTLQTQTAMVLAIFMELLPEEGLQRNGRDLTALIRKKNMHLNTGFVGTPYICRALSKLGYDDYAYQLLLNDDYPSWLREIKLGATTVWERWNSVLDDGKISGTGMNSLNHYAYGSVEEWIYRDVCGINPVEKNPGFKKVILRPHIDRRLKFVKSKVQTAGGSYEMAWEVSEEGLIKIKLKIPFDCEAELKLPKTDKVELLKTGEYEYNYRY